MLRMYHRNRNRNKNYRGQIPGKSQSLPITTNTQIYGVHTVDIDSPSVPSDIQ